MAYSSQLGLRGWILAICLAGVLTGVFWWMHGYSLLLTPERYLAQSVKPSVAVTVKAPLNMATASMRDDRVEVFAPSPASEWLNYRSRPATTGLAALEPHAQVRLVAPQVANASSDSIEFAVRDRAPAPRGSFEEASPVQSISMARDFVPVSPTVPSRRSRPVATPLSQSWPQPTQLISELERLGQFADDSGNDPVAQWTGEVLATVEAMSDASAQQASVADGMARLQELAQQILDTPSNHLDLDRVHQLQTRIAHSILRRLAVWNAVWACIAGPSRPMYVATRPTFEMHRLDECIQRIAIEMEATGDVAGWENYLLLEDLRRLASGNEVDVLLAMSTAQVLLGRITSSSVNDVQRAFLDTASVRELADCLQPLAVGPVDYHALLADLEHLEEDSEHRSRGTLIAAMQSLRFAYDPQQIAISDAINTYYRNANVRIAVSEALINRLLPANQKVQRPVRQTILGAETRGNSDIRTSLHVRLVPDGAAWNLNLELDGKIQSQTRSSRGPATFFNSSSANVATSRSIRITSHGVEIQGSQADVQSQDALRGFETNYDSLPFVGDMMRYFAEKEFKEKRGPARRIMQRTIATQTDTEFDKQLERRMSEAEQTFEKKLIGPLRNLNLNPMVMDLQTTEERLIARYRLASDNALAANTPRPQAPADSLLSVQIHQSVMNNGFTELGLSDKPWTLLELAQSLAKQFGQEPIESLPTDVPSDIRIEFDQERPISIEFIEGRLWLTLRIESLSQTGRLELENFVIRTSYSPGVTGLAAELIHDGLISVSGEHLRRIETIALRAIFAKVFGTRSTIPMTSPELLNDPRVEGLAISQLVLEEHWLAIAISQLDSPHVANLKSLQR